MDKPDNRMRRPGALLICLFLSGCLRPSANLSYSPTPAFNAYRAREDCLYKTLCSEIRRRGTEDLEGAAGYASALCQQPVSQDESETAAPTGGHPLESGESSDERIAQIEFDWHAMAVAQQLKDRCGAAQ
jgi:hypothetical protein